MTEYSPNLVVIDHSALAHNLRRIRDLVGPGTGISAVVKADAYGHGMVGAARTFVKAGAERLAVAHVQEGVRLREEGLGCPIVVLCGVTTREEAAAAVEKDLIPVLSHPSPARTLDEEGRRRNKRIRVQLKIDTGMGRLGIPHTETGGFLDSVCGLKALELEGMVSHLSSADEPDRGFTESQIRRFEEVLNSARARGSSLSCSSLANSAGVLWYPESRLGMVRPGIALYGGLPSPGLEPPVPLAPAMTLRAQVLQVRHLHAGTAVSYGRTFVTKTDCRMAVTSAGYSDGLPRSLSNKGQAMIHGTRVPILGRVCMNLIMVDVSGVARVEPGDEAVFLGSQGGSVLSGDDVAAVCGTISYEIFCAVGQSGKKMDIA